MLLRETEWKLWFPESNRTVNCCRRACGFFVDSISSFYARRGGRGVDEWDGFGFVSIRVGLCRGKGLDETTKTKGEGGSDEVAQRETVVVLRSCRVADGWAGGDCASLPVHSIVGCSSKEKKKAHTEPSGPSRDADGGVVVRGGSGSNCFGVAKTRREHAVEARHNNPREMMKKTTNQKIVCRDGNTTENENLAHTSFYVRNTYVEFEHIGISMGVYFFGL